MKNANNKHAYNNNKKKNYSNFKNVACVSPDPNRSTQLFKKKITAHYIEFQRYGQCIKIKIIS